MRRPRGITFIQCSIQQITREMNVITSDYRNINFALIIDRREHRRVAVAVLSFARQLGRNFQSAQLKTCLFITLN